MRTYGADKGAYPNYSYVCLGESYPQNNCASQSTGVYGVGIASNSAAFNDEIRPYMGGGKLPLTMKSYVNTDSGGAFIGAYYEVTSRNVYYFIEDTSCAGLPGVTKVGGDTKGSLCIVNLPIL